MIILGNRIYTNVELRQQAEKRQRIRRLINSAYDNTIIVDDTELTDFDYFSLLAVKI